MSALHRTRQVLSSAVPEKWLQAVKKIPANARKENRKFAAFCGDKLLGAVLAQKLQSHHQSDKQKLTVGKATILAGTVLSNRFLADRLPLIVPNHNDDGVEIGTHSQGTIVEAAVAAVYDQDEEAVGALVEWLINEAPDVLSLRVSPKNELLDRGGKCAFTYRVGGPDHNPEFRAVVELNGETMSSTGNTKRLPRIMHHTCYWKNSAVIFQLLFYLLHQKMLCSNRFKTLGNTLHIKHTITLFL